MTKNLPASVHARLQNRARETKRPFQELLQYYAMERFLYRLSKSSHRERFVLKYGRRRSARATRDVDLLGRLDNSLEKLARVLRDVCKTTWSISAPGKGRANQRRRRL